MENGRSLGGGTIYIYIYVSSNRHERLLLMQTSRRAKLEDLDSEEARLGAAMAAAVRRVAEVEEFEGCRYVPLYEAFGGQGGGTGHSCG